MKFALIMLFFTLNTTFANEESTATTSIETSVIPVEKSNKVHWFISATTSNTLAKDTPIGLSIAYSFEFKPTWNITPRLYIDKSEGNENADQDFRIRSRNNKNVIVIGGDVNNYEEEELGIELLVGKSFQISTNASIEPYMGLGRAKGSFEAERTLESANEIDPNSSRCSNIFRIGYNCNYYRLKNEYKYNINKLILGVNYTHSFKSWTLGLFTDVQIRQFDYTTERSTQVQELGNEGAVFPEGLVANERPSESVLRAGAGVRF